MVRASNDLLRYAVPADRLLRSVGLENIAETLPLKITGTVREMAFFFYNEKKDYKKALQYAERWLALNPRDYEVLLCQARCYRNFGDPESLNKASRIITRLETTTLNKSKRFTARLFRERAIIAENSGDSKAAKQYYRQGISIDRNNPYPENYVGLARLLLQDAEELPIDSAEKQQVADEALRLLETARKESAQFERFHFGTYIDALILAGDEETAFPLLEDALIDRPNDPRLNFKMAEILREEGRYGEAKQYAVKSRKSGYKNAVITIVNIYYGEALEYLERGLRVQAQQCFEDALANLSDYSPTSPREQEVSDTIAAKISRTLDNWEPSRALVQKYPTSDNAYTLYEQIRLAKHDAESAVESGKVDEAIRHLTWAIARVENYQHTLTPLAAEISNEILLFMETLMSGDVQ